MNEQMLSTHRYRRKSCVFHCHLATNLEICVDGAEAGSTEPQQRQPQLLDVIYRVSFAIRRGAKDGNALDTAATPCWTLRRPIATTTFCRGAAAEAVRAEASAFQIEVDGRKRLNTQASVRPSSRCTC